MELGMVGLGRMGGNMSERLLRGGHRVVGYAQNVERVQRVVSLGGAGTDSLGGLVAQLRPPCTVWLMIPSEAVDATIEALLPLLARDDVVIDGGNSYYKDSVRRAARLAERGLHFVDVGTSGGIWGLREGYSMMVGGDRQVVKRLTPIFQTLAPAPDRGWGHVGPTGAGHFVKMIHNGIEYGMMQAYAEGFALMRRKEVFGLDLRQIAEIWKVRQRGTVMASRPGGAGPGRESEPRGDRRPRAGQRGGTLDRDGGHRARGRHPRDQPVAGAPVPLARGRAVR